MAGAVRDQKRLIVYVPGLSEKPEAVSDLFDCLQQLEGYGTGDTVYWQFPDPVRRFDRGTLAARCRDLADRIDTYRTGPRATPEIVLVGRSIGGMMLRYAYLQALRGIDGPRLEWAQAVTRIVLLASPNRGVDPRRLPLWRRLALFLYAPVLRLFTVGDLLTGSPFVTNLRILWMRELAALGPEAPLVVQVRAKNDVVVNAEDSRDLEALPTGAQRVMPLATHTDIVSVDNVREDYIGQRYDILRWAITEPITATQPAPLPADEATKTSVVFALHGIRSGNGDWPAALEYQVSDGNHHMLVVTPSYGRLSAYDFALPFTRRRNLRWFADQYTYYLARHPGKPFHFVGHSNGTYLFGQSLEQIPALAFDHVYLAGSVLPRDFDWVGCADRGQLRTLVNVCANEDKPVGWLCSALRGLGMRDVGVGGFTGFDMVPPGTRQIRHIEGGHGAAVVPQRLSDIASFIHTGECATEPNLVTPSGSFGLMSRFAPMFTWLAAGGLLALGWLAVTTLGILVGAAVILGLLTTTYVGLKIA